MPSSSLSSIGLPPQLLRRYLPELVDYTPLLQARIQTPSLMLYTEPAQTLAHLLIGYSVNGVVPSTMNLLNEVGLHALPDNVDAYYTTPREIIRQTLRESFAKASSLALSLIAKSDYGWTRLDAMRISHTLRLGYDDPEQAKAQHVLRLASRILKIRAYLPITANAHLYRTLNQLGQLRIHPILQEKLRHAGWVGLSETELLAIQSAAMLCMHATSNQFGISLEELDAWYWGMEKGTVQ